jgi:hypothetical protein
MKKFDKVMYKKNKQIATIIDVSDKYILIKYDKPYLDKNQCGYIVGERIKIKDVSLIN